MPPFKAATPGTIVTLAATALLIVVCISVPITKSVYFLSANINASARQQSSISGSGVLKLGCFGFCIDDTCTGTSLGYGLDSSAFVKGLSSNSQVSSEINNALGGLSSSLIKGLTYPLGLLHPIAAGFAGLAALCGIFGHFSGMAPFCIAAAQWLTGLGATVGGLAFIFDIVVFTIAKSRINAVNGSSTVAVQAGASYGNAIWLTLAAFILLAISGCCFRFGTNMARVQRSNRSNKPMLDEDYAWNAREDALEAEKLRAADGYGHVNGGGSKHERGLPSFAESIQRRREPTGEAVPLRSMAYDEDLESGHNHEETDAYDRQSISGVGQGYGRRAEEDELRSPSHAQAFTSMYDRPQPVRSPSPPIPFAAPPAAGSAYPTYAGQHERQQTGASTHDAYNSPYAPRETAIPFYPAQAAVQQPSGGVGSVYADPYRPNQSYGADDSYGQDESYGSSHQAPKRCYAPSQAPTYATHAHDQYASPPYGARY